MVQAFSGSSLSRKLIGFILALYLGIAITLTSVQLFIEFRTEKDNLIQQVSSLADTFHPTLSKALWNYEDEQIYAAIDGLYKNPLVFGVVVGDLDTRLWRFGYYINDSGLVAEDYSANRFDFDKKFVNLSRAYNKIYKSDFILSREKNDAVEAIGRHTIYFSSATVVDRVRMTFMVTIISALIKTLCLWVISILVINKVVADPLSALKDDVDKFNINSTAIEDIAIYTAPQDKSDEISELQCSISSFASALVRSNKVVDDYSNNLEEKVVSRTISLNKALDDLSLANAIKDHFLVTMSHEIRTPMNALVGAVQLLEKTELNRQQKDLMGTLRAGGKSLLELVDNILDLAKIEGNTLQLNVEPFELTSLLDSCVLQFEKPAEAKGLRFLFCIEQIRRPLYVSGDAQRVAQVINHLLANAVKFTQRGDINLSLVGTYPNDSQIDLVIQVKDTGLGMSVEQQARVFDMFTQVDTSTTRGYGGTGLGLAIAKGLAEVMAGTLELKSDLGQGSEFCFKFSLPLARAEQVESQLENCQPGLSSGNILLVDDIAINRIIAQSMLEGLGFSVITANDGLEALAMYRQRSEDIDFIFMDCDMPGMDGFEATREIRLLEADLQQTRTPIVALTASSQQEARDKCLAAGMDGFLSKPIDEDLLLASIENHSVRTGLSPMA